MGAALTYARRYALFALVGIAGEDDLDAPNLNAPEPAAPLQGKPWVGGQTGLNGGRRYSRPPKMPAGQKARQEVASAKPRLKAQLSAVLHNELTDELKGINSEDGLAIWARRKELVGACGCAAAGAGVCS